MTELARRLDELGDRLAFPPTPDLLPGVLERISPRPRRRYGRLAVALAAVATLATGVLAVSPGARSALLDLFDVGGVRIERVGELPEVEVRARPFFGERVTLAEAELRAGFRVRIPQLDGLEEPDAVFFREAPARGTVTLVYGDPARPRLALSQWRGQTVEPVAIKLVPEGTAVDYVRVRGGLGVWIGGSPDHFFGFDGEGGEFGEPLYLAGSVLVWEQGRLAFRLEADVSREDALTIARAVR
jgi:hypothetical protein